MHKRKECIYGLLEAGRREPGDIRRGRILPHRRHWVCWLRRLSLNYRQDQRHHHYCRRRKHHSSAHWKLSQSHLPNYFLLRARGRWKEIFVNADDSQSEVWSPWKSHSGFRSKCYLVFVSQVQHYCQHNNWSQEKRWRWELFVVVCRAVQQVSSEQSALNKEVGDCWEWVYGGQRRADSHSEDQEEGDCEHVRQGHPHNVQRPRHRQIMKYLSYI